MPFSKKIKAVFGLLFILIAITGFDMYNFSYVFVFRIVYIISGFEEMILFFQFK